MRILNLIFLTILSSVTLLQNTFTSNTIDKNENIVGEWIIDLRPSPDADPYLQTFTVVVQNEKNFVGSFYGSPVENTSLNNSWDKLYFAFKSSDSTHEYYQSGYIVGEEIFGTTFCPGRNFVMPWSGKKKKK